VNNGAFANCAASVVDLRAVHHPIPSRLCPRASALQVARCADSAGQASDKSDIFLRADGPASSRSRALPKLVFPCKTHIGVMSGFLPARREL
jgi:hypothetical protein